uniref:HIT domain-containing protein n=1 Tax=candidate division WOR-3 bacterium TaxID=2052148 RepID=A0A7C4GCB0_UNCW3
MKRLWAPWRAEYIYCGDKPAGRSRRRCLFCRLPDAGDDRASLILLRGRQTFMVMNRFPYNNGHLMVAPFRHVAGFDRLTPAEERDLFRLVRLAIATLRRAFKPHGFNIGANLGAVAGAGVVGHVHLHIVPRWQGDTNFLPLLGETKVVSEHLESTYNRLAAALRRQNRPLRRRG